MPSDRAYRILVGHLGWEVARFGAPLALGMGLQTLFNLVDAYLIARLEKEVASAALGAIGICDQVAALGTILSYGLSIAAGALISRKLGQRDLHSVREIAWQSLLCMAAVALFFGLFGALSAHWIVYSLVGVKGQVAELSVSYLRLMLAGSPSIFLLLHFTTLQRALGSSKTPVLFLVAANLLNLFLAVLLVYGPGPSPKAFAWGAPIAAALGIPRLELLGAAWATLIARFVVLVPLVFTVVRRFGLIPARGHRLPHLETLLGIWRLGWPSSAQLVVRMLAMLITHSLVARAFTTEQDQSATTALGIVFRLETMALFIGLGWGSAAQTFMGQNLGAANLERAKLSGWYAAFYNCLMMAALAISYTVWGRDILRFFEADPQVMSVGMSYLRWVSASYVALGLGVVLAAAMQGAGATLQAFLLDALVVLGFQLPASVLILVSSHASYQRVWQVVALTYVTFALVYAWQYQRGRFLHTVVV